VPLDTSRGFDMFWIIGGAAVFRAFAKLGPDAPDGRSG
jgi:hypothetical protein